MLQWRVPMTTNQRQRIVTRHVKKRKCLIWVLRRVFVSEDQVQIQSSIHTASDSLILSNVRLYVQLNVRLIAFLSTKVGWRIPHEVVNHKRQVLSISGLKSNSACLLIPNFHQISITGESTCESIHESITAANLSIKLVKVAAYNGDATDK